MSETTSVTLNLLQPEGDVVQRRRTRTGQKRKTVVTLSINPGHEEIKTYEDKLSHRATVGGGK